MHKQTPKTPMTANNHRLQNVHNHISTKNHHHNNAKKGPQSHTHIDKEPPSQQCKTKSTITYSHRQRTTITTMQQKVHNHILTSTKNHHHNNATKSPQSHTHNMQNWQRSHTNTSFYPQHLRRSLLCITPESVIENHYVVKQNTFERLM